MKAIIFLIILASFGCKKTKESKNKKTASKNVTKNNKDQKPKKPKTLKKSKKQKTENNIKDFESANKWLRFLKGSKIDNARKFILEQGEKSVDILIKNLKSNNKVLRINSVKLLGKLKDKAAKALPLLQKLVTEDEWFAMRSTAIESIYKIDPDHEDNIKVFTRALKDKAGLVRWNALLHLGKMGEKAKAVEKEIRARMKDDKNWVRFRAAIVLADIFKDPSAFETIKKDYKSGDMRFRKKVIVVMEKLKDKEGEILQEVLGVMALGLQDKNTNIARIATNLLKNFGSKVNKNQQLIKVLKKTSKSDDYTIKKYSTEILNSIGKQPKSSKK
ncbi:MAG: HEAT repeat domain-containing protein [Myxococcota bacterium]